MAVVTITIPDAAMPRIQDAFATAYNWDSASGVTKAAFTKTQVIEFIKRTVVETEARTARKTTTATATSEVAAVNIT